MVCFSILCLFASHRAVNIISLCYFVASLIIAKYVLSTVNKYEGSYKALLCSCNLI